jgi:hypothetical protein
MKTRIVELNNGKFAVQRKILWAWHDEVQEGNTIITYETAEDAEQSTIDPLEAKRVIKQL